MIFRGKRSGVIHNFTMDVNPGFEKIEKFRGRVQMYVMDSNNVIPSISFILRSDNGKLISFNGQSKTFRLSIKEV